MKTIKGNLLDQKGILCHQVNLHGVMGAGLALQIRQKWPSAHDDYVRYCRKGAALGDVVFSQVDEGVVVAHIFCQMGYFQDGSATDYDSYPAAFAHIDDEAFPGVSIFIPHGIGCGIAGGDWNIILPIIEEHCPNATIVKFEV